jgi:thioredoxin 1
MIHKVDATNFEELILKSEVPVLLTFGGQGCGACEKIQPVLSAIGEELGGKLFVGKVDAYQHPEIAARYNVRGIPVTLLMKQGKVLNKIVGSAGKTDLIASIEPHMA